MRRAIAAAGLACALLVLAGLVGCGSPEVDANRAKEIAVAFARDGLGDADIKEIVADAPRQENDHWSVNIDVAARYDRSDPQYLTIHYVIGVDRASGRAWLIAQG